MIQQKYIHFFFCALMKKQEIIDFNFKDTNKIIEVVLFKYKTDESQKLTKAKIQRALKQAHGYTIKYL